MNKFSKTMVLRVLTLLICVMLLGCLTLYTNVLNTVDEESAVAAYQAAVKFPVSIKELMKNVDVLNNPGLGGGDSPATPIGSGTDIKYDPDDYYTDMPNITGNATNPVTVGGIVMYKDPTLSSTSNTYFFNSEKAIELTYDTITANYKPANNKYSSDRDKGLRSWCCAEHTSVAAGEKNGNLKKVPNINFTDTMASSTIGGVRYYAAAFGGAIVSKDYFSQDWNNATMQFSSALYGNYNNSIKFNVVVKDNGGTKYYIPMIAGDAKAHTSPYAAVQTGIHRNLVTDTMNIWDTTTTSPATLAGLANAEVALKNVTRYDSTGYMQTIEWCVDPSNATSKMLNQNYHIVGVIVYK